jgi:hypothetical protein
MGWEPGFKLISRLEPIDGPETADAFEFDVAEAFKLDTVEAALDESGHFNFLSFDNSTVLGFKDAQYPRVGSQNSWGTMNREVILDLGIYLIIGGEDSLIFLKHSKVC